MSNAKRIERIKQRLENTIPIETPGTWYHEDIPMLLDALKVETRRADEAEAKYTHEAEMAEGLGVHMREVADNYMADCDRWKTKAQALEMALREIIEQHDQWCFACKNDRKDVCRTPTACYRGSYWQFDQTQYDK